MALGAVLLERDRHIYYKVDLIRTTKIALETGALTTVPSFVGYKSDLILAIGTSKAWSWASTVTSIVDGIITDIIQEDDE